MIAAAIAPPHALASPALLGAARRAGLPLAGQMLPMARLRPAGSAPGLRAGRGGGRGGHGCKARAPPPRHRACTHAAPYRCASQPARRGQQGGRTATHATARQPPPPPHHALHRSPSVDCSHYKRGIKAGGQAVAGALAMHAGERRGWRRSLVWETSACNCAPSSNGGSRAPVAMGTAECGGCQGWGVGRVHKCKRREKGRTGRLGVAGGGC